MRGTSRKRLAAAVVLLLVGSALIAFPRWATRQPDLKAWTAEQIAAGREASKSENFLVAIACLTDVLRRDPKNSEALALRGAAYLHLDRTDLALDDASQAIRLDPNNAERHSDLADVYEKLGDTKNAARERTLAEQLAEKQPTTK